jgi:DNA-binding PadR family transcriptional regulator
MTGWHALSGFQRDLLQAIADVQASGDQPYGLALQEWLAERSPEDVNHSRVYQNLDRLVEDGLVTRAPIDDRTNAYTLTPAGERLLVGQAHALAAVCDGASTAAEEREAAPTDADAEVDA